MNEPIILVTVLLGFIWKVCTLVKKNEKESLQATPSSAGNHETIRRVSGKATEDAAGFLFLYHMLGDNHEVSDDQGLSQRHGDDFLETGECENFDDLV